MDEMMSNAAEIIERLTRENVQYEFEIERLKAKIAELEKQLAEERHQQSAPKI